MAMITQTFYLPLATEVDIKYRIKKSAGYKDFMFRYSIYIEDTLIGWVVRWPGFGHWDAYTANSFTQMGPFGKGRKVAVESLRREAIDMLFHSARYDIERLLRLAGKLPEEAA